MEINNIIAQTEIFSELPPKLIGMVSKNASIREYKKGDFIFKEGEEADSFYIIKEGTVIVKKSDNVIAVLKSGDFFGEMALVEEYNRSATIIAGEKLTLIEIHKNVFNKVVSKYPPFSLEMIKVLSKRVRETDERMIQELLRQERLTTLGKLAGTVIHDLKGPIGAIKGYLELLVRENVSNEDRITFVSIIKKEVDRLLGMIQELLEFSRGKSSYQIIKTDVSLLMSEILVLFEKVLKDKNITLEKHLEENLYANIDPQKTKRAIINIVNNAIEAMGNEGTLFIATNRNEKEVEIKIKDTGKGMDAETLAHLFEPFFTKGKSKGTGLGSAIAKKIIEEEDGRIDVESMPMQGTSFTIKFPASL